MIPRWLVLLTFFAMLCAVLEGLSDTSPAWFVQVCGALSIACPLLLLSRALHGPVRARHAGEERLNGVAPAAPTR